MGGWRLWRLSGGEWIGMVGEAWWLARVASVDDGKVLF